MHRPTQTAGTRTSTKTSPVAARPALPAGRRQAAPGRLRIGQVPNAGGTSGGSSERSAGRSRRPARPGGHAIARLRRGYRPTCTDVARRPGRFPPGSGIGLQSVSIAPGLDPGSHRGRLLLRCCGRRSRPGHDRPWWPAHTSRGHARLGQHAPAGRGRVRIPRREPGLLPSLAVRARSTPPAAAGPDTMVFVNAWNEWAEGAHLGPRRPIRPSQPRSRPAGRRHVGTTAVLSRRRPIGPRRLSSSRGKRRSTSSTSPCSTIAPACSQTASVHCSLSKASPWLARTRIPADDMNSSSLRLARAVNSASAVPRPSSSSSTSGRNEVRIGEAQPRLHPAGVGVDRVQDALTEARELGDVLNPGSHG